MSHSPWVNDPPFIPQPSCAIIFTLFPLSTPKSPYDEYLILLCHPLSKPIQHYLVFICTTPHRSHVGSWFRHCYLFRCKFCNLPYDIIFYPSLSSWGSHWHRSKRMGEKNWIGNFLCNFVTVFCCNYIVWKIQFRWFELQGLWIVSRGLIEMSPTVFWNQPHRPVFAWNSTPLTCLLGRVEFETSSNPESCRFPCN
jgi:hypothetical protein